MPDDIIFDPASCTLSQGDRRVEFSPSEAIVFRTIFRTERVTTFDTIIMSIYHDREEADWSHGIAKIMVHRIRRKTEAAGIHVPFRNVWGKGYQRECIVTILEPDPVSIPAELLASLRAVLGNSHDPRADNLLVLIGDAA